MFIDDSCIYKLFLSANSTNSYSKIFIFIWTHEHYNRQDPQDKPFEYITMKRIQSDKHKLYTVEQEKKISRLKRGYQQQISLVEWGTTPQEE